MQRPLRTLVSNTGRAATGGVDWDLLHFRGIPAAGPNRLREDGPISSHRNGAMADASLPRRNRSRNSPAEYRGRSSSAPNPIDSITRVFQRIRHVFAHHVFHPTTKALT